MQYHTTCNITQHPLEQITNTTLQKQATVRKTTTTTTALQKVTRNIHINSTVQ